MCGFCFQGFCSSYSYWLLPVLGIRVSCLYYLYFVILSSRVHLLSLFLSLHSDCLPALISLTWSWLACPSTCLLSLCVFPLVFATMVCLFSWTLYFASSLLDGFASFELNPWFSALLALVTFSLINHCTGPALPAASTFGSKPFPSISGTFCRNHALV